jgi:N-acetylglutamate synthase-like GNAT family acetyltransferase
MTQMSVLQIRAALESDQAFIEGLVKQVGINPNGLDWHRFLIAEDQGQRIGIGQVKPHGPGVRELASIATVPERRGQGIATKIINALLEKETQPLYLMCEKHNETFYQPFGFKRIGVDEMPPYFKRIAQFMWVMTFLMRLFGQSVELVIMKQKP